MEDLCETGLDILYAQWNSKAQDEFKDEKYQIQNVGVTDCASLYDHIKKDAGSAKEERTRYAILILKEDLQQAGTIFRWSPTSCMLADALTKRDRPDKAAVRQVMLGTWQGTEPRVDEMAVTLERDKESAQQEETVRSERATSSPRTTFGWTCPMSMRTPIFACGRARGLRRLCRSCRHRRFVFSGALRHR